MKPRAVFPTLQAPRESRSVYATGTTSSLACRQCDMPDPGLPPLWSPGRIEDVLDLEAEERGDLEGEGEAGVVLPFLDRIHSLPGDVQAFGDLCLGPGVLGSKYRETVSHLYLMVNASRAKRYETRSVRAATPALK